MHIYIYSACLQAYYTQERSTQQEGGGGRGVVHSPDRSHFGNENDHDLRSLRLSAAARSIVGVKTNFRDRNRGGQNRRSSVRRDRIAVPPSEDPASETRRSGASLLDALVMGPRVTVPQRHPSRGSSVTQSAQSYDPMDRGRRDLWSMIHVI